MASGGAPVGSEDVWGPSARIVDGKGRETTAEVATGREGALAMAGKEGQQVSGTFESGPPDDALDLSAVEELKFGPSTVAGGGLGDGGDKDDTLAAPGLSVRLLQALPSSLASRPRLPGRVGRR